MKLISLILVFGKTNNVDVGDAKLTRKAAPAPQAEEAVEETAEEFGNY